MPAVPMTCGHCGAPLELPDTVRFVTCTYCSTRLEVIHEHGASYTAELAALAERVDRLADEVRSTRVASELDEVDRQWNNGVFHSLVPVDESELDPEKIHPPTDWIIAISIASLVGLASIGIFEIIFSHDAETDIAWAFRFAAVLVSFAAGYATFQQSRAQRERAVLDEQRDAHNDAAHRMYQAVRDEVRRAVITRSGNE